MILISRLITYAAIEREESRGTHFRSDFLKTDPTFNKRKEFKVTDMNNFLQNKKNKFLTQLA